MPAVVRSLLARAAVTYRIEFIPSGCGPSGLYTRTMAKVRNQDIAASSPTTRSCGVDLTALRRQLRFVLFTFHAVAPASTVTVVPVTLHAPSLIRNATTAATSAGRAKCRSALRRTSFSRRSSSRSLVNCVSISPGATALTVIPSGPTSRARERVKPTSAALLAA